jgi:actin-related protein
LGELLFGNVNNEEINIAYSLLNVIKSLYNEDRKKLIQNIVLTGGSTMFIGFYKRFVKININIIYFR